MYVQRVNLCMRSMCESGVCVWTSCVAAACACVQRVILQRAREGVHHRILPLYKDPDPEVQREEHGGARRVQAAL